MGAAAPGAEADAADLVRERAGLERADHTPMAARACRELDRGASPTPGVFSHFRPAAAARPSVTELDETEPGTV